jgi:hypothetical protein
MPMPLKYTLKRTMEENMFKRIGIYALRGQIIAPLDNTGNIVSCVSTRVVLKEGQALCSFCPTARYIGGVEGLSMGNVWNMMAFRLRESGEILLINLEREYHFSRFLTPAERVKGGFAGAVAKGKSNCILGKDGVIRMTETVRASPKAPLPLVCSFRYWDRIDLVKLKMMLWGQGVVQHDVGEESTIPQIKEEKKKKKKKKKKRKKEEAQKRETKRLRATEEDKLFEDPQKFEDDFESFLNVYKKEDKEAAEC